MDWFGLLICCYFVGFVGVCCWCWIGCFVFDDYLAVWACCIMLFVLVW